MKGDTGQAGRVFLVLGPDDRHAVHVFDTVEAADSISDGHFPAKVTADVHLMRLDAPLGTPLFKTEHEWCLERREPSQSDDCSPLEA